MVLQGRGIRSVLMVFWVVAVCGCTQPNPFWAVRAENKCHMSVCPIYELDEPPQQLNKITFNHSAHMKPKWKGTAKVKLFIDTSGWVQCVELIESSGNKEWDVDVIEAAKRVKFTPAKKSGKRVWSSMQRGYGFDSTQLKEGR